MRFFFFLLVNMLSPDTYYILFYEDPKESRPYTIKMSNKSIYNCYCCFYFSFVRESPADRARRPANAVSIPAVDLPFLNGQGEVIIGQQGN